MRGGVVSRVNQSEPLKDQVDRILAESKFDFIQRGTFGFVFKVTYNGAEPSGFIDFETGIPSTVFVLKVQAMDFEMSLNSDNPSNLLSYSKRITWDKLTQEVKLQKDLFERALDNTFRPPCPAILDFRSITLEKLESYIKGQVLYEDQHEAILPTEYSEYNAGMILMEFVPAPDVSTLSVMNYDDIYFPRFQEIRNKAFRTYCTALQCGVDQVDVLPQNYLFGENGTITMIDFGIAQELKPKEASELMAFIDEAEKGDPSDKKKRQYIHLKTFLRKRNFRFDKWMLDDTYGITCFDPVKPLEIDSKISEQCKGGLCTIRYPAERKRTPQQIETRRVRLQAEQRRDMEIEDRKERAEAERLYERPTEREPSLRNLWGRLGGTKRRIKYEMGNRRVKKVRTRRKIYDYSFRKL